MAAHFQSAKVRAVAVHAGPTSSPRTTSLEQLRNGNLDIVFSVDMFNEGVDLPAVDTVLMLRPTESSIVWLQQFGRGLRRAAGKSQVRVIDYIGNHRTFLTKVQSLMGLVGEMPQGDVQVRKIFHRLERREIRLPRGCEVVYELKTIEIVDRLLRRETSSDAIRSCFSDFLSRTGVRPTAREIFYEGMNPRSTRPSYGSWFGFVEHEGQLTEPQRTAYVAHRELLTEIEATSMTKSLKMLALLAMLQEDVFPGIITINQLAARFRLLSELSPAIRRDFPTDVLENDTAMQRWIEQNPINAWIHRVDGGGRPFFEYSEGVFRTAFPVDGNYHNELSDLVRELVDWRIAEYESRSVDYSSIAMILRVLQSNGRPIIKLDRNKYPHTPTDWTTVLIDGQPHDVRFVKEFVNVARPSNASANNLPKILQQWFGPLAGQPGTRHEVELDREKTVWRMRPRVSEQNQRE